MARRTQFKWVAVRVSKKHRRWLEEMAQTMDASLVDVVEIAIEHLREEIKREAQVIENQHT